jgi:predicted dehydrogenase
MKTSKEIADPAMQQRTDGSLKTLRAGIIGAGRMGITHLAILGGNPSVKVVAITDDSSLMNRVLTKFRPDIKLFENYEKMIQASELDVVLIATPPHLHAAMINSSLDAGLSVFVEKPFTLGGEDARRLTQRSREQRGTFQVGYVNRFNDIFMNVKHMIDAGILGPMISFRSDMFGRTITKPSSDSGWRGKRENGGGCLYEFGSHAIDLMIYFFGKPDQVSGSSLTSVYSKNVDDVVQTDVLYKSGLKGSLTVNWSDANYRKPTNKIEVVGERGKILADQHELKLILNEDFAPYQAGVNTFYITDSFTPVPFYVRGNEFSRQLFHFAECAKNPAVSNLSSFSDATMTQEVIDMVLADAGVDN